MKCLHLPEWDATLRFHDLPGAGPPVVFLHGLGAASSLDLVGMAARPPLSGHRRLLIDLLGFGYSDRPAGFSYSLEGHARSAAAVLDAAGADRCWVIGHSMGGTVGIVLADLRPDLVSALVVAEGNLDPGVGGVSMEIAAMAEGEYVAGGHEALAPAVRRGRRSRRPGTGRLPGRLQPRRPPRRPPQRRRPARSHSPHSQRAPLPLLRAQGIRVRRALAARPRSGAPGGQRGRGDRDPGGRPLHDGGGSRRPGPAGGRVPGAGCALTAEPPNFARPFVQCRHGVHPHRRGDLGAARRRRHAGARVGSSPRRACSPRPRPTAPCSRWPTSPTCPGSSRPPSPCPTSTGATGSPSAGWRPPTWNGAGWCPRAGSGSTSAVGCACCPRP